MRILVTAFALVGCKCECVGMAEMVGDDHGDGGHQDAGSGGGQGGGSTGGGDVDAGDGTEHHTTGPGTGTPFVLDGGDDSTASGVTLDPMGNLILNAGSQQFFFMWIANASNGWVSKYDTRTAKEVARYFSTIPKDCANSAGPPCAGGALQPALTYDQGNSPSRTAIDLNGDVWIANRAPSVTGSVTKIANDLASCIDRNGDGKITTSKDLDGDGKIDPSVCVGGECEMIIPSNKADPLTYDECVLFSTVVGTNASGDIAERGIAISRGAFEGGGGDVWVANYHEARVYKLDNANGQIVPTDAMGSGYIQLQLKPYGLIVDGQQRLWALQVPSVPVKVALIDTMTGTMMAPEITAPSSCGSYALGIDGKDRFWVPGLSVYGTAGPPVACRYDRSTDTWTTFSFPDVQCSGGMAQKFGRPRGIAVDDMGQVYMDVDSVAGGSGASQVIRFDAETGAIIPFGSAQCIDATDSQTSGGIGIALDGDGNPWVNNGSGNAMKVDKVTGAVTRTPQQEPGLYTYSDFTGYELRKFTAPRGTYAKDFKGCSNDTRWKKLSWTASVPSGTSLQAFIKVGDTAAELDSTSTPQFGPFTASPVDLEAAGVPHKLYARVTFVLLSANHMSTPVLQGFDLSWNCVADLQ